MENITIHILFLTRPASIYTTKKTRIMISRHPTMLLMQHWSYVLKILYGKRENDTIIDVLSDNKLTHEEKSGWMHSNNITNQDLIDAANYVTIERNFYKRKYETTNKKE